MKKIILAAVTAAMLASPIAITTASAAPRHDRDRYSNNRYAPPPPAPRYQQRWNRGQRFDYRQARNYREVNDWQNYRNRRLYQPPRGYHWVRSGNDAVLVAVAGGLIGAVLAGAFN